MNDNLTQQPRIENLPQKVFVGVYSKISYSNNRVGLLWKSFMPRRSEIAARRSPDLYSIEFSDVSLSDFTLETVVEKWAALEVVSDDIIPEGMSVLQIEGGLYAVFIHKGSAADLRTFSYIFDSWLPLSNYECDLTRPRFEIMQEGYDPNDSEGESRRNLDAN